MKKYNLLEQGVEGVDDEVNVDTQKKDDGAFLQKLRDTYKCSFLQGGSAKGAIGDMPAHIEKTATTDSKTPGLFKVGDTLYIMADFTFNVYTKGGTSADGKKIKRVFKKNAGKWGCPAYQKENVGSVQDVQSLTQSQIDYIDSVTNPKASTYRGLVKLDPKQQAEVDLGKWKPVDLYDLNVKLFPDKGKYFVYRQIGEIQTARTTPQQDEIINDLIKKKYVKDEPAISESDKYIRVNLRTLEGGKYAQYFQKDFFMWQPISEVNPQEILAKRKQTLDTYSVNRKECRQTIDTLHTFWAKGIPFDSDSDRIQLKNHAKRCLKQKEFGRGVDKKVAKLASLPKTDPFTLAESKKDEIKSVIHENLIHLSQNKKKIILEQDIVKHRIGFVLESYDKHKNVDKLIGDLIYEYNYLHDQGFEDNLLFEQDGSLLGWGLGRAGGGIMDTVLERFIQGILQGMGVDPNGWFATILSVAFGNLEYTDLPKLFRFDCGYITGLISKTTLEVIIKKFVKFGDKGDVISDILRNTVDSMFRNSFESQFQELLKNKLCPILAKFTTNATQVNKELETKVMS